MKVLYVVTSADRGGAQKYVLSLAKKFSGVIAASAQASWLFEEAARQNIPTIKLKHLRREISPLHDYLAVSELKKVIEKEQPDIVHLNSTKAGVLGAFASPINQLTKQPIPSIYTVHGFILNEPLGMLKRALYGFLERFGAKYRAFTIAVSRADERALRASGACRQDAVKVVYNGLESIDFLGRAAARQQLNLSSEGIVVGAVANFYPTKGLDVLIESINRLTKQPINQATNFVIIGSGPEKEKFEQLIKRYGLENQIKLVTDQAYASRLLKAFDIFVLPSRKEGMPFALLEAMQAGLPIVATNVGGVPEALGHAGLLVPPNDAVKLSQAIEHAIKHPEIRTHLGREAHERSKLFTSEKMLAETAEIYESVMHNRKA